MRVKRATRLLVGAGAGAVLSLAAALSFSGGGVAGATPVDDVCKLECHQPRPVPPPTQPPIEEECDEDGDCVCIPEIVTPVPGASSGSDDC